MSLAFKSNLAAALDPSLVALAESLKGGHMGALRWLADESFPDAANRSVATTAVVLTLGQLAGPRALAVPPGFLLVRTSGQPGDPIDSIVRHCVELQTGEPTGDPNHRAKTRASLSVALKDLESAQRIGSHGISNYAIAVSKSRRDLLGTGRVRGYSAGHDSDFGWGVDESRHVIARLDSDCDRKAFLSDAHAGAPKLLNPKGLDESCRRVSAGLSVAGSIGMAEFDGPLARAIVEHTMPILVLPHTATEAVAGGPTLGLLDLSNRIAALAGTSALGRCHPVRRVSNFSFVLEYHQQIALRLHHCPADYGFLVDRTLRELVNLCWKISEVASVKSTSKSDFRSVTVKLISSCFHAVLLGVESLVWHGLGVHDHQDIARLLPILRSQPSISKRDLLRKAQWLRSDTRDRLLESMASEGLVTIGRNDVRATPFAEFVAGIPERRGITPPVRLGVASATSP